MDVANPLFLAKYTRGRVHGTLVYPNALAGAVLLLFPIAIVVSITGTRRFRVVTRVMAIALASVLGAAVLFWTGSKSGWLIALSVWASWLFRLCWPVRLKWATLALVLGIGLAIFGLRFHNYFAAGAASVGARFDYWKAAVQTTMDHPVFGTGPGTFQRPYERLKPPEAEMARLTHNDYLEQFSDSGIVGGLSYVCWIGFLLTVLGRRAWNSREPLQFAVFLGLLGWFVQGFSEFGLYVPALAWAAFTLSGCLLAWTWNEFDKSPTNQ
jgi:O-antigen ligase